MNDILWNIMAVIGFGAIGLIGLGLIVVAWCWWMEPRVYMEVSRKNFQGIWSRLAVLERGVLKKRRQEK